MADKQTAKIGQGKPGPGRPRGSPNKLTKAAREAFELAFDQLGSVDALVKWARANQSEFYRLYARLIPMEHTGTDGGPVQIVWPLPRSALD